MKENLVLDVRPSQLLLSKDGSLKVGFFDKLYEIDVKRDERGNKISSRTIPKLYIRIEIPGDNTTVVEKAAGERKIIDGETNRWVEEKVLFQRAYDKYLERKNEVVSDPYAEIEELKKQLSAEQSKKEVKVKSPRINDSKSFAEGIVEASE